MRMRIVAHRKMAARGWYASRDTSTKPGIYEVPLGMNMKKFIYEVAAESREERS